MNNTNDFEKLYSAFVNGVYRYAYLRLGNQADAEDVTSETFLRILAKGNLSSIQNPQAWAIGVARNIVNEKYREHKQPVASVEEVEMTIPANEPDPDTSSLDQDMLELVTSKLSELEGAAKEVIALKIWEGLKFNEISELLGEKESTIKLRYYRGLERLKGLVQSELGGDQKRKSLVVFPLILGAVHKLVTQPAYAASFEFTQKLSNLPNIQQLAVKNILDINKISMEKDINPIVGSAQTALTTTSINSVVRTVVVGIVAVVAIVTTGALLYMQVNQTANEQGKTSLPTSTNTSTTSLASPVATGLTEYIGQTFDFRFTYPESWQPSVVKKTQYLDTDPSKVFCKTEDISFEVLNVKVSQGFPECAGAWGGQVLNQVNVPGADGKEFTLYVVGDGNTYAEYKAQDKEGNRYTVRFAKVSDVVEADIDLFTDIIGTFRITFKD